MTNKVTQSTFLDATDKQILRALDQDPRATIAFLAQSLGLARGTVHARMQKLYGPQELLAAETIKVPPSAVGRPLRAIITAQVEQSQFDELVEDVSEIHEVVECLGVSGNHDLHIEVVAADADDIYRVTQRLMMCRGVTRTSTMLVLREVIPRRMSQLLR
ncbi:Lrp/AsnC family transcriptional regulator [Nesterenkonia ebinurensis]|uniref:Lrp/AsnC family transcriptional regulator n=1 Tax=Nesterenkonia ebinurensis TaxID=2608252 RepID=UPI00123E1D55|nr:Lrp/AsnC family transcriptional regulator [Nesterenkonia ebinurensis]